MDAFSRAGKNIALVLRAGAEAPEPALHRVGVSGTAEIKRILSTPGRGRTYKRRSITHRASAPGDPPAVDLGHYRASWSYAVHKLSGAWELIIGTPAKIGPWLEYGTSKMAARPHLRRLTEKLLSSGLVGRTVGDVMVAAQRRRAGAVPRA